MATARTGIALPASRPATGSVLGARVWASTISVSSAIACPGASGFVQARSNVGDIAEESTVLPQLGLPGPRHIDLDDVLDPAGPRGHDDDAVGQEYRLRYAMRHE